MKEAMDCKYFDACSAPMCPKDTGVENTAWFPGEEICRLVDIPEWVKRQRKIAKKAGNSEGFFTLSMLQCDCRISQGLKGIDPDGTDSERKAAEKAWLEKHPAITEEQREKLRVRGEKQKAVLSRFRSEKQSCNQGSTAPSCS